MTVASFSSEKGEVALSGGDVIKPDSTDRNDGGAYSTSNGVYTVQKDGEYDLVIDFKSDSRAPEIDLVIDDTVQQQTVWKTSDTSAIKKQKGQFAHFLISNALDLTKGQRWWLVVSEGATPTYSDLVWFLRLE